MLLYNYVELGLVLLETCVRNKEMVTTPGVSYQPPVTLQGEPQGVNNTTRQEPKENQVQPKQAAAADSQSSDEASFKRAEYRDRDEREQRDNASEESKERGSKLDVEV